MCDRARPNFSRLPTQNFFIFLHLLPNLNPHLNPNCSPDPCIMKVDPKFEIIEGFAQVPQLRLWAACLLIILIASLKFTYLIGYIYLVLISLSYVLHSIAEQFWVNFGSKLVNGLKRAYTAELLSAIAGLRDMIVQTPELEV